MRLRRGNAPGTIYLIEPDLKKLDELPDEAVNAHSMNPVRVLQLVRSLGGMPGWLRVVGCEPAVLEAEDGAMGLSEKVTGRGRARHRADRRPDSAKFCRDRKQGRDGRSSRLEPDSMIQTK